MPYGIIGVALLTALLPRMSRAAARRDIEGVVEDLSLGTRLSALGLLPVTAALTVLGPALGVVAFSRGNTTTEQAAAMGTALALGAFGLLPMAVTLLQLRVFYAMKDARTPTLIQVGMVAVRVPLLLLVPVLVEPEHVVAGLMVATSVTYVAGWVLGHLALRSRLRGVRSPATPMTTVPMTSAASDPATSSPSRGSTRRSTSQPSRPAAADTAATVRTGRSVAGDRTPRSRPRSARWPSTHPAT